MGARVTIAFKCCYLATALSLLTVEARADEVAERKKISAFLSTSWQTDEEAVAKAEESFEQLGKLSLDNRALYARALVCVHQRRYEDAGKVIEELLASDEKSIAAWRMKVWLNLLSKKYSVATTAASRLGEAISTEPVDTEQANDAARFLGAMFGYLEGPVGDSPAAAAGEPIEKAVLAGLTKEQQDLFRNARQDVLERYTSLTSEKVESKEKAIDDAEKDKEKVLKDIADRRAKMETQAEDLSKRRAEVQKELRSELDQIAEADRPLVSEQMRYESQLALVRNDQDSFSINISRLQDILSREKDPRRRDDIRREIVRDQISIDRLDASASIVIRQIRDVQARRGELAARQAKAQNDLGGQINRIDRDLAGMPAEQKKLDNTEKRYRKPATGQTGKVRALSVTATALNTYEPFPLEQEKERLLASLR